MGTRISDSVGRRRLCWKRGVWLAGWLAGRLAGHLGIPPNAWRNLVKSSLVFFLSSSRLGLVFSSSHLRLILSLSSSCLRLVLSLSRLVFVSSSSCLRLVLSLSCLVFILSCLRLVSSSSLTYNRQPQNERLFMNCIC